MERLSRTVFVTVLVLAGYYALFGGRYSVLEMRSAARERDQLQRQVDSLHRVNEQLTARVDSLEHDPTLLERVAREEFGMIKPGEVIYRRSTDRDTSEMR